jgi:hypothetical protein
MPGTTSHYQLTKLFPGDSFALNNQQYTSSDRDTIDRVLYLGAQGHNHTGVAPTDNDPTSPADLVLDQTQGSLPAGTRVTYVYTYVDPTGAETAPSPESYLDLPSAAATPVGPGATANPGDGNSLPPGGYFYELSAYSGVNTNETPVSPPAYVTLVTVGSIDLQLPALPSGADGFNAYRLGPGQATYSYLSSIDMTQPVPPTDWLDDGTNTPDPNRVAPSGNTSQATNNITVTLNDPPPTGWPSWNLYRTLVTGQWGNTLVASISALDGNGNLIITYQDLGLATSIGSPPAGSTAVGSPTKVMLTDGAEVQGVLPQSMIEGGVGTIPLPFALTFVFSGTLAPITGVSCWVCPWTAVTIDTVVCSLGRSSTPNAEAVVIDVLKGSGALPTYSSIYGGATPNPHPLVSVGQQVGAPAPPNVTNLAAGDTLSVDILQSGGGTGTDHDLTVTVQLSVTQV